MSKPASGVYIQSVLDEASLRPLPQRERVYQAVKRAIAAGALGAGDKLPSARQLAVDWALARGAVDEAFAQLQMEGLIRRHVGDGTYVQPPQARAALAARGAGGVRGGRAGPASVGSAVAAGAPPTPPLLASPRGPSDLARHVLQQAAHLGAAPVRLECAFAPQRTPPLHPRAVDLDGFALPTWRRLLAAAASEQRRELLNAPPSVGLAVLRESVARYLGVMRGVPCRAEQVLIVASPAEGLNLLVRLLLPPRGSVWVEEPTHPSLPSLLQSLGASVTGVPLDAQGFDVAEARRRDAGATLVYLHPLGHYPLGRRTSVARGDELIEWARRHGRWIVEGHFNDELWPREVQPPALARRDRERVFLLGTFESMMFPSLRLGYLVVPTALMGPFAEALTLWGPRAPAATQWALAEFIDRGHLHQRIAALRERYTRRRQQVQRLLIERLPPGWRAEPLTHQPTACLHLPADARMSDLEWLRRLRAKGLVMEPLSSMHWSARSQDGLGANLVEGQGSILEGRPSPRPASGQSQGLVLGYGDWSDAEFEAALARLAGELHAGSAAAMPAATARS